MNKLNHKAANISKLLPEKILQFGGGNFLRGFVDWMVDIYNEKTGSELGILVVKPTERGNYQEWREQDGLFHVLTKGIKNGALVNEAHLVKCVSGIVHPYREWEAFLKTAENPGLRYIISNTTETGIRVSPDDKKSDTPPHEFPAKLTLWLYRRFRHFNGSQESGCVIIPTELLERNGELLRDCILQNSDNWGLEADFKKWIQDANIFCNTLVDRIIPGIGENAMQEAWQRLGFQDKMMTQGEPYHLWAIEAPQSVRTELPLDKAGLNIVYTDDLTPYRVSKVRILNGAHTAMVPVGYLYGIETVRETLEDEVMGRFVREVIFDEIIQTLDLPGMDVQQFASDVLDRFRNPFIKHKLLSISLNSVSKFKVRVLPSLLTYREQRGVLPKHLVLSLAALIRFYKGGEIPLNDEPWVVDFFKKAWAECDGSAESLNTLVEQVLTWEQAWETDLSTVPDLAEMITAYLLKIEQDGMPETVKSILP